MKVYVVTMYRWGDRERHSYIIGVYDNSHDAMKIANEEREYRGGKYLPEVLEWKVGTPLSCEEEPNWVKVLPLKENKRWMLEGIFGNG